MNLYRLDYVAPDGSVRAAVPDPTFVGQDFLTRHWSFARSSALAAALETGGVVAITRISGAGAMRVMAHASGETGRVHRVKK